MITILPPQQSRPTFTFGITHPTQDFEWSGDRDLLFSPAFDHQHRQAAVVHLIGASISLGLEGREASSDMSGEAGFAVVIMLGEALWLTQYHNLDFILGPTEPPEFRVDRHRCC